MLEAACLATDGRPEMWGRQLGLASPQREDGPQGKGLLWGRSEEKSSLGFSDCAHSRPFGLAGPEVASVL